MRYTILAMEDQPGGMVRVTIDTSDYHQATCVVPKESLNDHGTIAMLDRLWDQAENIKTLSRRTGTKVTQ